MPEILNETEVRVTGSLIEKQVTTPEYYPLTLNALVNACNQIQNRHPVVSYDEKQVARTLERLREKNHVHVVFSSDSRVPKYRQVFTENYNLNPRQTAVMCVLMLRGPQTVGEIKGRTSRLFPFQELSEVEATLDSLIDRAAESLVVRLPRQAGQKEMRYAHLLSGEVTLEENAAAAEPRWEPATREVMGENERISRLEEQVKRLQEEVATLRRQLDEFKKQFE